ncbi:ATP-dependent helicase, partial [Bacteroidota bacterium]
MSKISKNLNTVQLEAVKDYSGPSLIIAGAGSGKTRVLTYRIAYLLEKGIDPNSILALTFTNKAAREMKERIFSFISDSDANKIWIGTFHSMFSRILRTEAKSLGYTSSFTIYDSIDSKNLIKSIIRELKLDDNIYKPGNIAQRISLAKNNLISAQAYNNNSELISSDQSTNKERTGEIYKIYSSRCFRAGAMDFDDLLLNTNILFRDFPEILAKYQDKFRYILVDEYQDTNFSQYLIIKKLSGKYKNICVVGDDAQSIYSFRGAKIENILNFKNDYPEYKLFKLEQNYRSTQNIVNAANSLIKKNKNRISKNVWSDNENGEKVKIIKTLTDHEEGFIVSNSIFENHQNKQLSYKNFAILYRTNAQSRIFEESLRKQNIPYRVYGSISFYQRKEIKDMISYFRLCVNPNDEEAILRIINYPARGIGKTTIDKIRKCAQENNKNLWGIITGLDKLDAGLNKGTVDKLKGFSLLLNDFSSKIETKDASSLALYIAEKTNILKDLLSDSSPENFSKSENISELLNGIREFTDNHETEDKFIGLDRYIENVSLLTSMDEKNNNEIDKVSIMTIHSAKGLEFDHVYIVGLEEDLFPSQLSSSSQKELEEERRLFYVAITRAKKLAVITYTQSRYKWGKPINCIPSRFIREIDESFID